MCWAMFCSFLHAFATHLPEIRLGLAGTYIPPRGPPPRRELLSVGWGSWTRTSRRVGPATPGGCLLSTQERSLEFNQQKQRKTTHKSHDYRNRPDLCNTSMVSSANERASSLYETTSGVPSNQDDYIGHVIIFDPPCWLQEPHWLSTC